MLRFARPVLRAARRGVAGDAAGGDVVIVGGGVVGSSVALHLALRRRDLRIVVVERDSSYAVASAPLSAGGIRQQFSNGENVALSVFGAHFLKEGLRDALLRAGAADLAADAAARVAFREAGYLTLASEAHAGVLRENQATQAAHGADWIEVLDRSALGERFPWLECGEDVVCGAFGTRNEGYFDPWGLLDSLRKGAERLGVTYVEGSAEAVTRGGGGATGVELADGRVLGASVVVNAAGAHAAALAVPGSGFAPPIAPRKRCIFAVSSPEPPSGRPRPPADAPLTVDVSGCYLRGDLRDGRYLCGVSPPEADDPDVSVGDLENVDYDLFERTIWPALAARVPAFESLRVEAAWAGLYEYNTLDQNACIGPYPDCANLYISAGFSGHGLQHAPGVGRGVAELVDTGAYETIDLAAFGCGRVGGGAPFLEANIW